MSIGGNSSCLLLTRLSEHGGSAVEAAGGPERVAAAAAMAAHAGDGRVLDTCQAHLARCGTHVALQCPAKRPPRESEDCAGLQRAPKSCAGLQRAPKSCAAERLSSRAPPSTARKGGWRWQKALLSGAKCCASSSLVYDAGAAEDQGHRETMEDTHAFSARFAEGLRPHAAGSKCMGDVTYAGVFDGHGGTDCAEFLKARLHHNLARELMFGADPRLPEAQRTRSVEDAFRSAYQMTQLQCRSAKIRAGSTAVTCLLHRDPSGQRWLHTANVGDAAAILCRVLDGKLVARLLTSVHRPSNPEERKRIQSHPGGAIFRDRVMGVLAVTRALGDIPLKKEGVVGISARPDTTSVQLEDTDAFVVLCCDGVTDVLSADQIVQTACTAHDQLVQRATQRQLCESAGAQQAERERERERSDAGRRPESPPRVELQPESPPLSPPSIAPRNRGVCRNAAKKVAQALVRRALRCGSRDNVTSMVLVL